MACLRSWTAPRGHRTDHEYHHRRWRAIWLWLRFSIILGFIWLSHTLSWLDFRVFSILSSRIPKLNLNLFSLSLKIINKSAYKIKPIFSLNTLKFDIQLSKVSFPTVLAIYFLYLCRTLWVMDFMYWPWDFLLISA